MERLRPTWIYHFTRLEHLGTIVEHGLLSDTQAQAMGLMQIEVGQRSIKEARARTPVPIGARGVVADYAPFYYAPRSPMMHNIHSGKVPSYQDGCDRLIYLATTTEELIGAQLRWVATDRNARLRHAAYTDDDVELSAIVNWHVMEIEPCIPVLEQPDRIELRMAEFLVHRFVPFAHIRALAVKYSTLVPEVRAELAAHGSSTQVVVRPRWYF